MSLLTHSRRPFETRLAAFPGPAIHEESSSLAGPEAPEEAVTPREAPESRVGRSAEAPDAGEGRAALFDHEFTHGRSQS